MSVRLVILGMLQWGEMHGYELKQHIERKMGDWTSIAFGSIYFALRKLADEGLVERVAEERHGNRPSRSIYRVTKDGRDAFMSELRAIWASPQRTLFPFDIGLFFVHSLPKGEVLDHLKGRIEWFEQLLGHVQRHKREVLSNPRVPSVAKAIFEHTEVHAEAELRWLESVLKGFESGQYS